MRLKSFHGSTMTDAMRAVREALGENAIIVATREDETGGVRVTAAIDDVTTAHMENRIAPPPDGSEALETIAEALTSHQVPATLAEKLMAAATQFANDDPLLSLGAAIDMHFKFESLDQTKPVMLVGPPGAGKTLCTAKFATQATLAKRKATVVGTDLDRAGGMEQLAAFTRLLKVNLVEIDDWHSLRDLVSIQKGNPIFIDMAGRNPFDPREKEFAREFIGAVGDATLVLPAGLDASEAVDLALEFRSIGAAHLLVTRLDTVKRIGSLLRLAYESRMPLSTYGASPNVTEPLLPMNPVVLARMILKQGREEAFREAKPEARKSAR
jgi:flagellar biosynthesis protein FlhF